MPTMLTITTDSFVLDHSAAYWVLEGYLNLPVWDYWSNIDGHTKHTNNGWNIKSTMNLCLERVDVLTNDDETQDGDIQVTIVWESFNAKEIASIEVIFYRGSFIDMVNHIIDDWDVLSPETAVKQQTEKELFGAKIAAYLETKLPSAPTAALLMEYKKIIENIAINYFSMAGLEIVAKKFGII